MSFSTDWDVNRYKADYESDEHWELRKAFIDAHKDKFPENELVCLAQVFTNIEFLGCKYPNKTMERVAHLSKDVAAKFRELRSSRLKRTFVGASDAASAKAKGRGSQATKTINQSTSQRTAFPSLLSSFRKQEPSTNDESTNSIDTNTNSNKISDNNLKKRKIASKSESDDDNDDGNMLRPSFSMNPSNENEKQNDDIAPSEPIQTKPQPLKQTKYIPNTGFIIYETIALSEQQQSINILQQSAAKQGSIVKFDFEVSQSDKTTLECVVRIDGTIYGTAPITTGKKEAKVQAFDRALEKARKIHYTIKQKSVHTVSVDVEQNDQGQTVKNAQSIQLNEDNKGFKMMKMLGWTGGSLGIAGNGIEQPISIEMKVDRSGLGLTDSTKLNYSFFVDYLTKYKTNESATYDLAFSKEFTKDERKTLHEIASRLSLKSRSHNTTDGSRYIVIFKKLELVDLANEILNGGLRSKCYELIAPTEPRPEQQIKSQKKLPPHLEQRKANKIGFNYAQKNQQNRNQNSNRGQKQQRRRKFF